MYKVALSLNFIECFSMTPLSKLSSFQCQSLSLYYYKFYLNQVKAIYLSVVFGQMVCKVTLQIQMVFKPLLLNSEFVFL